MASLEFLKFHDFKEIMRPLSKEREVMRPMGFYECMLSIFLSLVNSIAFCEFLIASTDIY
jgi:hypothetical protein